MQTAGVHSKEVGFNFKSINKCEKRFDDKTFKSVFIHLVQRRR